MANQEIQYIQQQGYIHVQSLITTMACGSIELHKQQLLLLCTTNHFPIWIPAFLPTLDRDHVIIKEKLDLFIYACHMPDNGSSIQGLCKCMSHKSRCCHPSHGWNRTGSWWQHHLFWIYLIWIYQERGSWNQSSCCRLPGWTQLGCWRAAHRSTQSPELAPDSQNSYESHCFNVFFIRKKYIGEIVFITQINK